MSDFFNHVYRVKHLAMNVILQPWPWYVSGPLIALTMGLLIVLGKRFGMSSNLRAMCAIGGAGRVAPFFRYDWKSSRWNLIVVLGVLVGGFIGRHYLSNDEAVNITPETIAKLNTLGFDSAGKAYLPSELFDVSVFSDVKTLLLLIVGGFLIGFGARYADGCTSGHAISGLSNLQWTSLLAVIGFFAGGLVMTHLIFPLIF